MSGAYAPYCRDANGLTHVCDVSEMTPRIVPDLIDIEQELFELPQKVRVRVLAQLLPADNSQYFRNVSSTTRRSRRWR